MFACQNFLQQSCSKFYKEQKLFYGHLMKMITNSSKVTHKADLGLSWNETDRFWKLYISQSQPIWLLLLLTKL